MDDVASISGATHVSLDPLKSSALPQPQGLSSTVSSPEVSSGTAAAAVTRARMEMTEKRIFAGIRGVGQVTISELCPGVGE
jgi:hypothetical protein